MFMHVLLPEPLAPHHGDELAVVDLEVDAARARAPSRRLCRRRAEAPRRATTGASDVGHGATSSTSVTTFAPSLIGASVSSVFVPSVAPGVTSSGASVLPSGPSV